jgi:hypothetical protein
MKDYSSMRPALKDAILESSVSDEFEIASAEWYVNYYVVIPEMTCICGQQHCKYIYSIKNWNNENILFPIGSECMKYFNWNEEEAGIINAYNKWHEKLYNNPEGPYHKMPFYEVIKDVDYIRRLIYSPSAENTRLSTYARAVWIHNPPIVNKKGESGCEKCEIQRQKGYQRCYQCHLIKIKKN